MIDDFFLDMWMYNRSFVFDRERLTDMFEKVTSGDIVLTPQSLVIFFDQIPTYIYRFEDAAHIVSYFFQKALNIFQELDPTTINNVYTCIPCARIGRRVRELLSSQYSKKNWQLIFRALPYDYNIRRISPFSFKILPQIDIGFEWRGGIYRKQKIEVAFDPEPVVVLVDGSRESSTLLHIMYSTRPNLYAVCLNRCDDISFALHICDYYGITLFVQDFDEMPRNNKRLFYKMKMSFLRSFLDREVPDNLFVMDARDYLKDTNVEKIARVCNVPYCL